jgi:hypothetical protein
MLDLFPEDVASPPIIVVLVAEYNLSLVRGELGPIRAHTAGWLAGRQAMADPKSTSVCINLLLLRSQMTDKDKNMSPLAYLSS